MNDAKGVRASGRDEWWKLHEAAMLALGSSQDVIETQIKSGNVQFDISSFMTDVVLADLNSPVHPFLLGRCLWVASKFPGTKKICVTYSIKGVSKIQFTMTFIKT